MKHSLVVALALAASSAFCAALPFYDVKNFGAVADGTTLDTAAIQKAVDACAADGGGKVIIPAGRYLTGAIFLKSWINIEIQPGAVLLGSTNFNDYPVMNGRWEGVERKQYSSMFTGYNLDHISITGGGVINGQGKIWQEANDKTGLLRKARGIFGREPESPEDAPLRWPRARMIYLQSCTNVLVRDITILDSPSWNIHPVYCEHVTLDHLTIISPAKSHNTDAVDPDSCRDVHISNCYMDVGDDDIVIKSGYNADGRRVGVPSENFLIENCTFAHGHGGVVIGSEMSGSVRNVVVVNCLFDGTVRGLRVKTALGRGGRIENFRASNLIMRNIQEAAFSVTSAYDGPKKAAGEKTAPEEVPTMRNFDWSDITVVSTARVGEFHGLAEAPLQDCSLRNVRVISAQTGIRCSNAKGLRFENIEMQPGSGPALDARKTEDLEVTRLAVQHPNSDAPVIQINGVDGALLRDCRVAAGTGLFLQQTNENRNIVLEGNRLAPEVKDQQR